jgi:hypothetical protein
VGNSTGWTSAVSMLARAPLVLRAVTNTFVDRAAAPTRAPAMRRLPSRLSLVLLLFFSFSTTSSRAGVIGLDAVHGASTEALGNGTWYAEMRSELQAAGHSLVILNDFAPQSLSVCDAIWVSQPRATGQLFSATDIAAIHTYVQSGGGLLAAAEGGLFTNSTVSNFNSLLAPYGVTINSVATSGDGYTVSGFVPHPVTSGIASVGIDFQRRLISFSSPAIDLTIEGGEADILAAVNSTAGEGNVVIMSDPAPFGYPGDDTNLYLQSNLQLLKNVAAFTTQIPEPLALSLLALGLVAVWRPRCHR